jgi:hypothetical protein
MKKNNIMPQTPSPQKVLYRHLFQQKFTEISEERISSIFKVKCVIQTRNQQEAGGKLANTFEGSR